MRASLVYAAILGALTGAGCTFNAGGGPPAGNAAQAQTYQEQVDAFDRQMEEADRQAKVQQDHLDRTQKQLELAERIMLAQEKGVERHNQIMAKWEEQARRRDAILDAEEQKAGIKPAKEGTESPP